MQKSESRAHNAGQSLPMTSAEGTHAPPVLPRSAAVLIVAFMLPARWVCAFAAWVVVLGLSVAFAAEAAVPVAPVVEREVSEFIVDGTTAATQSVDLRPAVTGYIVEQKFKNGAAVKKGDVLFVIDPRPFQADLDRAESELNRSEAARQLAEADLQRATELRAKNALSAQDYDTKASAALQARAAAAGARSARDAAKLNLDFTSITAPIDGLIGQPNVSVGSLVTQDPRQDPIATIRTIDPIHARAEVDERQLLNFLRARAARPDDAAPDKIAMQLPDETGFPHEGVVDFADNTIDPASGKFHVWGRFPNPDRLIGAGLSVRLRLPAGTPSKALLVPQDAVATDADGACVRVVNSDGMIETRRIKAGAWQQDGTRIVTGAISAGENVIVGATPSGQPVQTVPARSTAR